MGVSAKEKEVRKWVIEGLTGQERCTKPFVLTVDKTAKCHSSPHREGQSTVENAIKNIDRQEETDIRNKYLISQKSSRRFSQSPFFILKISKHRFCT